MTGALHGLRVIEMGQLLAGPFCGQLLGDMGADVIKVEPPGAGDPMREWGQGQEKVQWEVIARNKRSVSADMRKPEGIGLVRKLIGHADILVENFPERYREVLRRLERANGEQDLHERIDAFLSRHALGCAPGQSKAWA